MHSVWQRTSLFYPRDAELAQRGICLCLSVCPSNAVKCFETAARIALVFATAANFIRRKFGHLQRNGTCLWSFAPNSVLRKISQRPVDGCYRRSTDDRHSGVAIGCSGCAMHKGPAVSGPSEGHIYSGISFLLCDTECSEINWSLRFSTRTHSTVLLALKEAERPNC